MSRTQVVRAGGMALAVGGPTWAATLLLTDPPVDGVSPTAEILGGLAWQIGAAGLLLAAWLTAALGTARSARIVLGAEAVLLGLAAVWSAVYAVDPATQRHLLMVVLDVAWPLSVVGLIPVGVMVLRARVWEPPLRQLPLIASLWLPVDVAAVVIGGDSAGLAVRVAWLSVVWGGLGVLLAVRAPDTVRDRPRRRSSDDPAAEDRDLRSL